MLRVLPQDASGEHRQRRRGVSYRQEFRDHLLFLPGDEASDQVHRWREPFKGKNVGLQRDPVTEGYDVIPNFFISATLDMDFDYDYAGLENRRDGEENEFHSIHFRNRLFDRDTLILSHYDINFFRAMMPHGEGEDAQRLARQFFEENFQATLGKVYAPYRDVDGRPVYLVALQRPGNIFDDGSLEKTAFEDLRDKVSRENEATLQLLQTAFYVTDEIALGDDPSETLRRMAAANPIPAPGVGTGEGGVQVVSGVRGAFKRAVEASGWCPCPAEQCLNPEEVRMLVLPYTMGANLYRVVEGTLQKNVAEDGLSRLVGSEFEGVVLPSFPCHVWRVIKID